MTAEAPPRVELSHLECLALLHPLLAEIAEAAGVRVLFCKGLTAQAQDLVPDRTPGDIDLLTHPSESTRLRAALEAHGWAGTDVAVPGYSRHSEVMRHPFWPIELDVHFRFPGFLAPPGDVFETLWLGRETVVVAGREVPTLGRAAHLLLLMLNQSRRASPERLRSRAGEFADDIHLRLSPQELLNFADVARETGAVTPLRPVTEALGLDLDPSREGSEGLSPVGWWAFKGDLGAYVPLVTAAVSVSLVGYSSAMDVSER